MAEQRSKRSKAPDRRPARARYWNSGKLKDRKIRNLVRYSGFATKAEASAFWHTVRKRRYDARTNVIQ